MCCISSKRQHGRLEKGLLVWMMEIPQIEEMHSLVSISREATEHLHLFISLFPVSFKIQMMNESSAHWPFSNSHSEVNKSQGLHTLFFTRPLVVGHHMPSVPGDVASGF